MSTCARCGLEQAVDSPGDGPSGRCLDAITRGTGDNDWAALDCRDRQIAAQAALLRSVTGRLEKMLTRLDDLSEPCSIRGELDALLGLLS